MCCDQQKAAFIVLNNIENVILESQKAKVVNLLTFKQKM